MKKNRMMRVAVMLLALTLMTSCFVGGTFAKYVSTASGSDTATVADWNIQFKANDGAGQQLQYTNAVTVDLFATIKDSNGSDNETDISSGRLIAPGTSGSFKFSIENDSEVTARYKIDYTVTESVDIPIEFSVDHGTNWVNNLADVDWQELAIGSGAVEVTIQWRWAFGDGSTDEADTTLGLAGDATVTVKIEIIAEQVD